MIPKYTEAFPLHHATQSGSIEIVRGLLQSMKVDSRDSHNITPLMVAARNVSIELLAVLLEAGANINAKDRPSTIWDGKRTPLLHACQVGRVTNIRFLVERGAETDCVDQGGRAPLSYAILQKNEDLVQWLLEKGTNPNGPDKCTYPPIVVAAQTNAPNLVKELLKRGADPNKTGSWGNPALAETTSVECAQELLQHGADVNLKNVEGKTPLIVNLNRGTPELLKCYIDAGADVNTRENNHMTPLMCLTDNPRINVAEMLIAAGSDMNALLHPKCSVLDDLYRSGSHNYINERIDLITFLENKGAKRAAELRKAKGRR